jgi:DNA polymerase-3 subunit gamma/tau
LTAHRTVGLTTSASCASGCATRRRTAGSRSTTFNALLKTLEEPPPHVKFLFATTEPHKVLATITSRCLRFDLRRIPSAKIAERLGVMAEAEEIAAEPGALALIARCAEGSLRDAQSIFDQVVAFAGKTVGVKDVTEILGLVGDEVFWELDQAVIDGHVEAAVRIAGRVVDEGRDVRRFIEELIAHYRDLLVALSSQYPEKVLDLPAETVARIAEMAPQFSRDQLLHVIELLAGAEEQLRYAVSPQVTLEVALIKLVRSRDRVPLDAVLDRIEALRGQPAAPPGQPGPPPQADLFSDTKKKPSAPRPIVAERASSSYARPSASGSTVLEPLSENDASEFGDLWRRVIAATQGQGPALRESIAAGRILSFDEEELVIGFDEAHVYQVERLSKRENRQLIEEFLSRSLGRAVRVTFKRVNNHDAVTDGGVSPAGAEEPAPLADDPLVKKSIELFGGRVVQPGR